MTITIRRSLYCGRRMASKIASMYSLLSRFRPSLATSNSPLEARVAPSRLGRLSIRRRQSHRRIVPALDPGDWPGFAPLPRRALAVCPIDGGDAVQPDERRIIGGLPHLPAQDAALAIGGRFDRSQVINVAVEVRADERIIQMSAGLLAARGRPDPRQQEKGGGCGRGGYAPKECSTCRLHGSCLSLERGKSASTIVTPFARISRIR